jgi:predicted dehydrogenase
MNVGIVGAGAIARRAHLPAYGTIPEIKVVGIADADRKTGERAAEEFGIPRFCSSVQELLEDDSIEIVDICTPTSSHIQIIEFAAKKRKHILVEKPLAITVADCLKIQRHVTEAGVKLCVVQNWRYFPSVTQVKERLVNGYLGKMVTMHGLAIATFPSNWTLGTWLYHKGGALYDFAPHLIDSMLYVKDFQPVKKIYASGGDFSRGSMDFINYAVLNIEFEDGSVATADTSWLTSTAPKFTIDIYGTAGNIFLDVRNNVFYETHGFPTPLDDIKYFLNKTTKTGWGVISGKYFKGINANLRPIIIDFMKAIQGCGEIPVPIKHAISIVAVLEAAVLSIERKDPVTVEEILKQ